MLLLAIIFTHSSKVCALLVKEGGNGVGVCVGEGVRVRVFDCVRERLLFLSV